MFFFPRQQRFSLTPRNVLKSSGFCFIIIVIVLYIYIYIYSTRAPASSVPFPGQALRNLAEEPAASRGSLGAARDVDHVAAELPPVPGGAVARLPPPSSAATRLDFTNFEEFQGRDVTPSSAGRFHS